MTAPIVSLDQVSKTFSNATVALKDMSLDIGAGQFISLLGPSGCGKSTALRIVAGLSSPTSGRLRWSDEGHAPSGRKGSGAEAHDISFVFQEPTLLPWRSAVDNLLLTHTDLDRAGAEETRGRKVREKWLKVLR